MIDALCMSGSYPFRHLTMSTRAVAERLASEGFRECFMFNLTALFHRDPWWGNLDFTREETEADCRVHKLAVFNPDYEDRVRVREYVKMGFVGFVTSPIYHGYRLTGRRVLGNLAEALNNGALVILDLVEDPRQLHRAYAFRFRLRLGELSDALRRLSSGIEGEVRILLSHFPYSDLVNLRNLYSGPVYVDLASSQVLGAPYSHVEELVKLYGSSNVVLSTGFMMKYPKSSVLKLQLSKIPDEDKGKIANLNAHRLYGV
jgi:predicted TIM-barrel fold metal-dependent hydrolase